MFPHLSVSSGPLLNEIYPAQITGECILEISGTGFGTEKGRVLLNDDEMNILKWRRKKIRIFVPEAYGLPTITITTKKGQTSVFQTQENEKDCTYDGLKSLVVGSGEISYSERWRRFKYNKKKGVAVVVRKDRNALVYFARTKVIPEVLTLYFAVNHFRKNEIRSGKIPLSSVNSFVNCEGRPGYSFMVKSFIKDKPYFQFYVYYMDDSRRIYQVILSSVKKNDCRNGASLTILKNIHFGG